MTRGFKSHRAYQFTKYGDFNSKVAADIRSFEHFGTLPSGRRPDYFSTYLGDTTMRLFVSWVIKIVVLVLLVVSLPLRSLADEAINKATEAFLIQSGIKNVEQKLQKLAFDKLKNHVSPELVGVIGTCYVAAKSKTVILKVKNFSLTVTQSSASVSLPF